MRRDIGNELVVAIIAVGVLAFALIFGVILSLPSPAPAQTATTAASVTLISVPTNESTSPPGGTAIPTLNRTEMSEMLQLGTQVVALLTASAQPQGSATRPLTNTDTLTATPTAGESPTIATRVAVGSTLEATDTPTTAFTASATSTAARTDTPTATPTETPPPTHTTRPTNTRTPAPSDTPAPPTPNVSATFQSLRESATAFAGQTSTPSITLSDTATRTRTPRPTNTTQPTNTRTATIGVSPSAIALQNATSEPVLSDTSTPTASRTPTRAATQTPLPESTHTPTPTPTSITTHTPPVPSATSTATASRTPTWTPEPTNTLLVPSATSTATASRTPTNTATQTPLPDQTNPPTLTWTLTATATQPRVLTDTPTLTWTLTATTTQPRVMSDTPTPTPSPTRTGAATETPFVLPTAIVLSGNVPIPTVLVIGTPTVLGECSLPEGWTTYTVQPGDTLFRIAQAINSTVGELRDANCLQNIDNIFAGAELFVPRLPARPVQPGATADRSAIFPSLVKQGCTFAGAQITVPAPGQVVTGVFTVFGTATVDNFQFYRIEVRPNTTDIYNFYDRIGTPVVNNALAQINSDLFDDGLHWIRLTVVDNTGNFPDPCAIPLIFH